MMLRKEKWVLLIAVLLAAVIVLSGCGSASAGADDPFAQSIRSRYPELKDRKITVTEVKRVVDGDTFETKEGDKVRLIGVNTPETVKPNSPVEKYGKEASDFTKGKLTKKKVYMFADAGDKDKYGRLLRYVWVDGEPVMFNEVLVRDGYANTMTVPPNVMFQKRFLQLEREARAAKKGLWADDKSK